MGTRAKLSIMGLYNYDPTIFDDMVVPAELDKDQLVKQILIELAELTVIYPDTDYMKMVIANWSALRLHTWQRMTGVLYEDYDPFVNIKRDELREITQERDLQGSGYTANTVNAWETVTPQEQSASNNSSTDTGTIKTTEHLHVEGDSAITDAQDVLRKELDVRIRYDMYRIITDEFKERFCLMLY